MDKRRVCMPSVGLFVFLACTIVWYGCSQGGAIPSPQALTPTAPLGPIMLTGNETNLADLAKNQFFPVLWEIASNPGKVVRVGVETTTGAVEFLELSFKKGNKALKIVRESTGKASSLSWGFKGLSLEDESRENIDIGFKETLQQGLQFSKDTQELLKIGAIVAGAGLGVWMAAGVASTILAALGFLAFLAVVVGLIVVSAALLSVADVTKEKIINWLQGSGETISTFLKEVGQTIQQQGQTAP